MTWPFPIALVVAIAVPCAELIAAENEDPRRLTVQRIFGAQEFEPENVSVRWMKAGHGCTTLESSAGPFGGRDIVRHEPKTATTEILVPAELLVPSGGNAPLSFDDYATGP